MEIKIGDYILTDDKELYRIVNIDREPGRVTYDIKSYKPNGETHFTSNATFRMYTEYKGVSRRYLRSLGSIIPEEKATRAFKILFE